jgi:hypothetical protein
MKSILQRCVPFIAFLGLLALPTTGMAQADEPAPADSEADVAEQMANDTSDKSGTNPINFQRDFRIYNEYSWLNEDNSGDGYQNVLTMEYRQAIFGGEWQFRTRIPYVAPLQTDVNFDGIDDIDESGLGDINFRLLKKPKFMGANAFSVGLEVWLDTASEDALGSGTTTLGPQLFYGWFFGQNPLPIPGYRGGGLFVPGLQYRFSIDEDHGRADTDAIAIDLNYLAMSEDKTRWLYANPQILIDRETREEYVLFDVEFGWMMQKWFPDLVGQSFYIRPTFTIGKDRPTDYGIEFGYKWVGW